MIGTEDYIDGISKSIIPILMTLMALYAAISGQLISRLISQGFGKQEIGQIVGAMERNVGIEVILLLLSFAFLASFSWLLQLAEQYGCIENCLKLFRNALVCFDFLYFVYVVYDSTIGLYHLLKS